LTTFGQVSITTGCVPTFTTSSDVAKTCSAGRIEVDAPATVSGADIAMQLVGHN
jgi:hypothetical protein